jgi:lipid-A-disaccharide synthase
LLQEACTPERLAAAVRELLDNTAAALAQQQAYRNVLKMLSPASRKPSEAAATAVLSVLDQP